MTDVVFSSVVLLPFRGGMFCATAASAMPERENGSLTSRWRFNQGIAENLATTFTIISPEVFGEVVCTFVTTIVEVAIQCNQEI